ncbi:MAG: oxidoreductase-like domain-containing protein [Burkholderiales bacterium]
MSDAEHPPIAPREPDPEECCGSGCALCVFDRYQQALERYHEQLRMWQAAHPAESRRMTSRPANDDPGDDANGNLVP